MRRYTITINGTTHEIEVAESASDLFQVTVDGILVDVQLDDHQDLAQAVIEPGVTPGRATTMHRAPAPRQPAPQGELEGQPIPSAAAHKPAPAVATGPAPKTGGADTMTAPMPGVVLSVDAAPGQSLSRGDLVMVIEAMKMKNEIRASRDGVVGEIPVSAGEQVKYGDVLVRFA